MRGELQAVSDKVPKDTHFFSGRAAGRDLLGSSTIRLRGAVVRAVVDDLRSHRSDGGLVDAEPLHYAGPEVLHEHVGGGGEALQDGPPLARLEVEGNGALVAVEVEELGRESPVAGC